MSDVRAKYVPPAIDRRSFNCPHCGVLAQQFWFTLHARQMEKDQKPFITENEKRKPFLDEKNRDIEEENIHVPRIRRYTMLCNIWFSRCYRCEEITLWIHDQLVWPQQGKAPLPNPDLPDEVRADYEEASTILHLSPRGAAALLRLSIQKLCKDLGGKGDNINADIAHLVKQGLPDKVQQALDVIRVIGNNAVHPGQLDIQDDRTTAETLFKLVNLIAESMISQPKRVSEMYDKLPEYERNRIEKRDAKQSARSR